MLIKNSKGHVFYGIHFYPGVAEYAEADKEPYRVFLNENTIREMDPSFAGRPVFVDHVDEVDQNVDEIRKEADGWVVESFFNAADGKHWVKFMVVSDRGMRAVKSGMRLSNAYVPTSFSSGGLWNGVSYAKEIIAGEYEHLAIVKHPRYEESVIMTPEEFKQYNEEKVVELKRLSNSKTRKEDNTMGLNLFKRTKVENAIDLEGMSVVLPKSKKELTISQLVNEADDMMMDKNAGLADMSHKVKMGDGSYCNVGELMEKHKSLNDELDAMKKKNADSEIEEGSKEVGDRGGDESLDNAEEDEAKKKKMAEEDEAKAKKNALDAEKKAAAKVKADAVRNARAKGDDEEEVAVVDFGENMVARGKARYGRD